LQVHQGVSFIKKIFSVLVEKDEDGYLIATVPTLPGCHTKAKSMDEILESVKEAIEAYLEAEKDVDISEFVGVQVVVAEAG
jgi:predicted RNase H-like HicB family nuclease